MHFFFKHFFFLLLKDNKTNRSWNDWNNCYIIPLGCPSFCNLFRLEHCWWLSGSVSACLDFSTSTKAFWQLSLNHQSSPAAMVRWLSYPGKNSSWCSVGRPVQHGRTFPSLITTPTGFNESRRLKRFVLLVPMCLWSNEWWGPSLAHYLDTEPALRRGRLFSSDKAGMLHVWCHFIAYSAMKVMLLLFENTVSPNPDDDYAWTVNIFGCRVFP